MIKISKSKQQKLEDYLEAKNCLLELCRQFDSGNYILTKYIAIELTNLFLDTNAICIAQQLNIKNMFKFKCKKLPSDINILPNLDSSLYQFRVEVENELKPVPFLESIKSLPSHDVQNNMSLSDYLNFTAVCLEIDGQKEFFKRIDIIKSIRNEIKGHSVDKLFPRTDFLNRNIFQKIKFFQKNIQSDGSFTLQISPQQRECKNNLLEVCLRQIAYECIEAINKFEKTRKYNSLFTNP
jgi:hypothetical protein